MNRDLYHRERRRLLAKKLHRYKAPEAKAPEPHQHFFNHFSEYDRTYRCQCGHRAGAAAMAALGNDPWFRPRKAQ